jgi:hypothetical protein
MKITKKIFSTKTLDPKFLLPPSAFRLPPFFSYFILAPLLLLALTISGIGQTLLKIPQIKSETKPDLSLKKAIIRDLNLKPEDNVHYYFNLVDLNGDGKPEAIVYLVAPSLCGTGGCLAAIFEPDGQDFKIVNAIVLANNPIIVSEQRSNGWNDLIFYVAGGGAKPHYVVLRYNGVNYPANPTEQPETIAPELIKGKAYIADDVAKSAGLTL